MENELGERCAKAIAQHALGAAISPSAAQRRLGSAGGAAGGAAAANGGDGARCGLLGIKLRSTGLTDGGVATLLAALSHHNRLQHVDLSCNVRRRMVPWVGGDGGAAEVGPAITTSSGAARLAALARGGCRR